MTFVSIEHEWGGRERRGKGTRLALSRLIKMFEIVSREQKPNGLHRYSVDTKPFCRYSDKSLADTIYLSNTA